MKKIQIQCSSIGLKKDELLALIPDSVKSQLSTHDKDYESKLKPYVLCHEGEARPSVFNASGKKSIVMKWTKDTVNSFISKLKTGLQFFDGHNPSNDLQINNVLGQLVAYGSKVVNGALSAIGIGYFPESVNDMDVVSAEFDVLNEGLIDNGNFIEVLGNAISDITGLALGSIKAGMRPAFPGAEALQVQAFEFIKEENKIEETKLTKEDILNGLSIEDIKSVVRARELRPTQVFDVNSILKIEETEEGSRKIKSTDESLNKWFKDHLKDNVIMPKTKMENYSELEKKYGALEKSYGEAKPHFVKSKASEFFQEISKTKNLSQNPKKLSFIESSVKKNLDKFIGDVNLLNKYVESEVDTYSAVFEEAVKALNDNSPSTLGIPALNTAHPQDNFTL